MCLEKLLHRQAHSLGLISLIPKGKCGVSTLIYLNENSQRFFITEKRVQK